MAKAAFVGIGGARSKQRSHILGGDGEQIQSGYDCLRGRTDGSHYDRTRREVPEEMRGPGSGKGHNRIRAGNGASLLRKRVGIGAALTGLLLLGLSLGSHPAAGRGSATAIAAWMLVSVAAAAGAAKLLPAGVGLGTAAGVLYAAGDVGTKAAVVGGMRLLFVPGLLACHGLAFVCLQLAFQRGGRLSTAGLAVLWTNALPILAGTVLFGEALPGGLRGVARVAAFAFVLAGAVALSRREPTALTPAGAAA